MRLNSIKFKISVLYVAVLGLILASFSAFLYISLRYTLYDEIDMELLGKGRVLSDATASLLPAADPGAGTLSAAARRVISGAVSAGEPAEGQELHSSWLQKLQRLDLESDHLGFADPNGNLMTQSHELGGIFPRLSAKEVALIREGNPVFRSVSLEKRDLRLVYYPFRHQGASYVFLVGTSLKPIIHLLRLRLYHIAISIPFFLLVTSFLGRIFASSILKTVMEVARTASKITHEDLSSRVRAEHVDEEMRCLVDSFNDMISRLDQSFRYIAEFSSQVSHELKTPLAIIKGESEIAMRKERSPEEYRRVIKVTLEEVERMLKVTEDLLLLTKLDYRPELFRFERLDLAEFLEEVCEQARILAVRKEITVLGSFPSDRVEIRADRLHFRRLLFNLLGNAVKFTPPGGMINITAARADGLVKIRIADSGVGIAQEDIPKIFEKFFQVKHAGHDGEPGFGLGLSIARSIANIHHATIEVESRPGEGSTFTVILPVSPAC